MILGFADNDAAQAGVGQLTTFNQILYQGTAEQAQGNISME